MPASLLKCAPTHLEDLGGGVLNHGKGITFLNFLSCAPIFGTNLCTNYCDISQFCTAYFLVICLPGAFYVLQSYP